MDILVKGKNMDVGDALRVHVDDRLGGVVGKFFERATDATVVFSREAHQFRVDITVHPGRGLVVQGSNRGDEAYGAFDGALDRIAKQLRRYKRRLQDHHKSNAADDTFLSAQQYVLAEEGNDVDDGGAESDDGPMIIAEMPTRIDTLTVGEAVMRMNLADVTVLMFRHGKQGTLNVIYRRPDGNIGWIDPEGATS